MPVINRDAPLLGVEFSELDPKLQQLSQILPRQELIAQFDENGTSWVWMRTPAPASQKADTVRNISTSVLGALDFDPAGEFVIQVGVTLDTTSESGMIAYIGGSIGLGIGASQTLTSSAGNDMIGLFEGVSWKDSNYAIGTGFHTLAAFYSRYYNGMFFYADGIYIGSVPGSDAVSAANNSVCVDSSGDRKVSSGIKVHYIVCGSEVGGSSGHDIIVSRAETLFPAGVRPSLRRPVRPFYYPQATAAATVPTLSNLSARLITSSSAQPQLDYTF